MTQARGDSAPALLPRYDAFISYNHNDKDLRVAERLSRRLRRYRPPGASRLKRRLAVFRDVETLTTDRDLTEELRERISRAERLVLLASPGAAASRYVNDEVAAFMKTNGDAKVVIVLVDGELATALPPALHARQKEPLYIDLRNADSKRFRLESLRLIAALYGVDYSVLRRLDDAERRKRGMLAAAASVALAFVVASVFSILTTPPETWARVPQPVRLGNVDPLMPTERFAINRADPSAVAWLGYNARYARDLAGAEDDARAEIREVLIATADPEYILLTSSAALEEELEAELEALGGEDLWTSLEESDEWATYAPPARDPVVILSGEPKEVKSLALASGLDEALADGLSRAVENGDIHAVEVLRRADADRPISVAVIVSAHEHHENVGELAPVHLYRGGSQTAWTVVDLPRDSPMTRIVDLIALDAAGTRALVVTDREGYFRTTDGGATWHSANFGEARLRSGADLRTVSVEPELYALAVLNHEPGDDDNPLFRLERVEWLERWRVGWQRWLGQF